jgi:hypothetical protein
MGLVAQADPRDSSARRPVDVAQDVPALEGELMKNRLLTICVMCAALAAITGTPVRLAGQAAVPPPPPKNPPPKGYIDPRNPPKEDPNYKPPMTAWGVPKIEGRWAGASDIIHYSIEDPEADRDEHVKIGGQRPMIGRPIIDPIDGKIPYQPWAKEFAKVLDENHRKPTRPEYLDPVARGFQEALPRNSYGGQTIIQEKDQIIFMYGYHHAWRVVPTDGRPNLPESVKLWMGSSRGHWEGNTLVVNTNNMNDQGWLQIIGGFHSTDFRLEERFTRVSDNHMVNIITVTDPKVYTQPWKIRVDYRGPNPDDEDWEDAVWEGNKLGGLGPEFWGEAKMDPKVNPKADPKK